MKGKSLRDVQKDYRETVKGLCLVCEKACTGFYGNYGNSGVCSKTCMQAYNTSTSLKNTDLRVFRKVNDGTH